MPAQRHEPVSQSFRVSARRSAMVLAFALLGHAAGALAAGPQVTAVITKQIEAVDPSKPSQVELVTLVAAPQRLALAGVKTPDGVRLLSSSQNDTGCASGQGECRQRFTLNFDTRQRNCSLNGAYAASFQASCPTGAAPCQAGSVEVPFQLASTASCASHEVVQAPGRWQSLPGAARDIGMGGGSLWSIGTQAQSGGFVVQRWDGRVWVNMHGGALRLDVDPQGLAWVVNDKGELWRHNGSAWTRLPGIARDVGIGADGTAWVIGAGPTQGGFEIFRWHAGNWQKVPGGGVRIDVDAQGNAWVVSVGGEVFRYGNGGWTLVPGVKANDIGIGGDGSVFVAAEDGSVLKWNGQGWSPRDGHLAEITADARGVPFGTSAGQQVWMGQP